MTKTLMVRSAATPRLSNHAARLSLKLPGLGELNLDPKLDLGQHGIEARIAGG
jgi:hypothetical protein